MSPDIYSLLAVSPAVTALLGVPLRVFSFGEVEGQPITSPYLVWQQVAGTPYNYLAGRPDLDDVTTQLDVYATGRTQAREVFKEVRNALEDHAYLVNGPAESREPETNLFRITFDFDWVTNH